MSAVKKTPKSKLGKREAPDGDSTKKKKNVKQLINPAMKKHHARENAESENVPSQKSLKKKKEARGSPEGSANKGEKVVKPLKVQNGSAKKAKKLEKTKFKSGVKRKLPPDGEESESKKPKLEQMKKKDRKEFRKKTLKNNYDLIKKTKSMWEELRRHNIEDAKRAKICAELANIIRGRAKDLIFAHDTCRVVQCLMQFGNEKQRTMLFEELKDSILEMMKSKYAKFFIRKIMKYGTKDQKNHVFTAFHGKVRKLIRHTEAAQILEYCYNDYANAIQRSTVVEEFYGPTFALFKTDEVRNLEQIMEKEPAKKDSILANMKEALMPLADKNVLTHSLVHRIFFEYFTYCSPQAKTEMIELLREQLPPMLHTRDGSRVAMHCIWSGTAKDRKLIVKSLKGHVVKLCKEEHGHLVLLAIFDSVDDTKFVQKVVLEELFKSVAEVGADAHGRKVLQYLMCRRDPRHFHPDIVKILSQGDDNTHSKKDVKLRARELLEFASPKLHEYVRNNTRELVADNASVLLMLDILTYCTGDSSESLRAVSRVVAEPFSADDGDAHIISSAAGHICLRKLIAMDKKKAAQSRQDLFSVLLLEELEPGHMKSWIVSNRGCFTLVSLFETELKQIQARIGKELSKCKKTLSSSDTKGAQVLLKKLELLS